MNLTLAEIAAATGGRLAGGPPGARVAGVSTDSRAVAPGQLFVALTGPRFDGRRFAAAALGAGAAAVLQAGGEAPPGPAILVADARAALKALAGAWRRRCPARAVAVTGSNGKTTAKEMLRLILAGAGTVVASPASFNNEIGVPLTLLSLAPETDFAVVEAGANAFGELAELGALIRPAVAVCLNVGPAHLAGFGDLAGVARAKAELLAALPAGATAVLNGDDPLGRDLARPAGVERVTFGAAAGCDFFLEDVRRVPGGVAFRLNGREGRLPVPGRHNAHNAAAAVAAARVLGLEPEAALAALAGFKLPPLRLERKTANGITLVNDAYNANPGSLAAALEELATAPGRLILVLGEMRELGAASPRWHRAAGELAARLEPAALWAVGEGDAEELAAGARAAGLAPDRIHRVATAADAARPVKAAARPGDVILVKGSRALGLEAVAKALANGAGGGKA